ncbi:site-specific integrase [Patescibacteria group bacterium]|nr:site-specific integrase [Patescibacteria group bacterium]MBU1891153.1 site-specific integrase [Patescibacteria group bacterium]
MINTFPSLLQSFFTDRLLQQWGASAHTVASYRDAFRLLLRFAYENLGKEPSVLSLKDLTPDFLSSFLDYVEKARNNSARTRNARLAAIHSFFRYVSFREPAYAELCCQILAIPSKRFERRPIEFLARNEIDALINAPDKTTWVGRRDRTFLLTAIQTGLRVSELIGLRCEHVVMGTGAHVRCDGKGRKQRCTPLRRETADVMSSWLCELNGQSGDPVFPSIRSGPLSRDAVERLVARHCKAAQSNCPPLSRKKVTPHVLRHTAAMELLHHGVDRSVIALWLGHESVETTQMYLHADMRLKQQALSRITPLGVKPSLYKPDDELLAFLEGL